MALDLLAPGGTKKQVQEFTWCAASSEGDDWNRVCVTDTAPSVMVLYSRTPQPVPTLEELASLAASIQAIL